MFSRKLSFLSEHKSEIWRWNTQVFWIIFRILAWILQSNSIHDNFHQVMDPLAPTLLETCTMALVGLFFLCCVTPKKGWVLSEERPCFVLMTVDFDCEHLFFCFSFFGFAEVFYFSANRPSVESFMTDFPFAGPEPWHVGEPTSAFWRPSNIPQIKEIMDFRIRSNYSRAFLRIPEFVEMNPSESLKKATEFLFNVGFEWLFMVFPVGFEWWENIHFLLGVLIQV